MIKPLFVIGHRNPDTDSICSAIGYAHLKTRMGEPAVPARAGKLNPETRFVLDHFAIEPPELIADLYPRAEDVMSPPEVTFRPDQTVREFGTILRESGVKSAPVVDADGQLAGIVSLGDLANLYIEELETPDLSETGVTFQAILAVLGGTLVAGEDLGRPVAGTVKIAASRTRTARSLVSPGDIVLVGDRLNIQSRLIEDGIACLILTGGAQATEEVAAAARERGVILIQAPYDTYTCARLVNQSIPVRMIMQDSVVTFKPSDLLGDIKETIIATKFRNYPVTENGRLVGMIARDRLIAPERERVILVDHNEATQAVAGIEEAHIVEIIDHHRLGGLETAEPIFIRHEPVGSTSTIVANMHWHRNIEIPAGIAGLLLAAIVSDTFLFKSPTSTPKDRDTAERLAAAAGLDVEEFGLQVLRAGANYAELSPADIILNDLKEFQIGEHHVSISQAPVMEPEEFLAANLAPLQQFMKDLRDRENYDLVLLMVTDVFRGVTHLIHAGHPAALLRQAFKSAEDRGGVLLLPGILSRKKQVVPPLVEAARELESR